MWSPPKCKPISGRAHSHHLSHSFAKPRLGDERSACGARRLSVQSTALPHCLHHLRGIRTGVSACGKVCRPTAMLLHKAGLCARLKGS